VLWQIQRAGILHCYTQPQATEPGSISSGMQPPNLPRIHGPICRLPSAERGWLSLSSKGRNELIFVLVATVVVHYDESNYVSFSPLRLTSMTSRKRSSDLRATTETPSKKPRDSLNTVEPSVDLDGPYVVTRKGL
jgi:hypothetical protein